MKESVTGGRHAMTLLRSFRLGEGLCQEPWPTPDSSMRFIQRALLFTNGVLSSSKKESSFFVRVGQRILGCSRGTWKQASASSTRSLCERVIAHRSDDGTSKVTICTSYLPASKTESSRSLCSHCPTVFLFLNTVQREG